MLKSKSRFHKTVRECAKTFPVCFPHINNLAGDYLLRRIHENNNTAWAALLAQALWTLPSGYMGAEMQNIPRPTRQLSGTKWIMSRAAAPDAQARRRPWCRIMDPGCRSNWNPAIVSWHLVELRLLFEGIQSYHKPHIAAPLQTCSRHAACENERWLRHTAEPQPGVMRQDKMRAPHCKTKRGMTSFYVDYFVFS